MTNLFSTVHCPRFTVHCSSIRCCPQNKLRNHDTKFFAVRFAHQVGAFHKSFERLDYRETVILMRRSGFDHRLLADHAFAFHFFDLAVRIMDLPMPAKKLHRLCALVFDPDEIAEDEFLQNQIRLAFEENGAGAYRNAFGGGGVGGHALLKCTENWGDFQCGEDSSFLDRNYVSEGECRASPVILSYDGRSSQ